MLLTTENFIYFYKILIKESHAIFSDSNNKTFSYFFEIVEYIL